MANDEGSNLKYFEEFPTVPYLNGIPTRIEKYDGLYLYTYYAGAASKNDALKKFIEDLEQSGFSIIAEIHDGKVYSNGISIVRYGRFIPGNGTSFYIGIFNIDYNYKHEVNKDLRIFINNKEVLEQELLDVKFASLFPLGFEEFTFYPIRSFCEHLNLDVSYLEESKEIVIDNKIFLKIDEKSFPIDFIENIDNWLEVPPKIIDDRAYVPHATLMKVMEVFQLSSKYDKETNSYYFKNKQ